MYLSWESYNKKRRTSWDSSHLRAIRRLWYIDIGYYTGVVTLITISLLFTAFVFFVYTETLDIKSALKSITTGSILVFIYMISGLSVFIYRQSGDYYYNKVKELTHQIEYSILVHNRDTRYHPAVFVIYGICLVIPAPLVAVKLLIKGLFQLIGWVLEKVSQLYKSVRRFLASRV